MSWFNRIQSPNRPSLAICYEVGKFQIMRNENDDGKHILFGFSFILLTLILIENVRILFVVPIIIDTKLQATDCQWNHDGSVLAVCGMKLNGTEKDTNNVIFYSAFGVVSLRILP